jgi:uncharacterized membrane protein YraQ (UPF0718 family)
MDIVTSLLQGGVNGLTEYLSAHVLTCLVPAFFIAGAISIFLSQNAVLRYFGPQAPKVLSYGVASISGTILAVCSCTVLPLFGGIYKRGAGLGPAVAFLYSGPAINVLAIVYSARLLGYDLGIGRAVGAVVFSVVIGLIMAALYGREDVQRDSRAFEMLQSDPDEKSPRERLLLFGLLVGILVFAASAQWLVTVLLLLGLGLLLWRRYSREELSAWMRETWRFVRLITPWLLGGVFIAGILAVAIPESAVARVVGGSSLLSSFVASFAGALMYFATLTEVPIVKAFLDLGMGRGPALALLLAGPALSIPNMLVIRSIMGTKRTLTYVTLVVAMATFSGYIYGLIVV